MNKLYSQYIKKYPNQKMFSFNTITNEQQRQQFINDTQEWVAYNEYTDKTGEYTNNNIEIYDIDDDNEEYYIGSLNIEIAYTPPTSYTYKRQTYDSQAEYISEPAKINYADITFTTPTNKTYPVNKEVFEHIVNAVETYINDNVEPVDPEEEGWYDYEE